MLNQYDIQFMEDSVRDVIRDWDTRIDIYSKCSIDMQPNYDNVMHEFSGDILCKKVSINAERRDLVANSTDDDGTILYSIPDVVDNKPYKPSLFDIVSICDNSDDMYYIKSIKDRIGESLVTLCRFVGNVPYIYTTDSGIFIRGYGWSND